MTFEEYWETQPHPLEETANEVMKDIARHAWNKALEESKRAYDEAILGLRDTLDSGIIIY